MAWSDKLKLKKGLILSLTNAGYTAPKEIQLKSLSRINGGQDLIAVGPQGSGKTTTYVLGALNRFNYAADGVTRVLILVHDKEKVQEVISQFELLNKNTSISIVGLYPTPGTEAQMDAMASGADIVVATPDRARAIYLKLGLNLHTVELLVLDDADLLVKQGLQLPVAELANSIVKCQHLVFTEVMHDKLHRMIDPFMKQPAVIEVEELSEVKVQTIAQLLYQLPNFGTKLNLLNLFVQDDEVFTKVVVFVNTKHTAETIYDSLKQRLKKAVAVYKPWFFEMSGADSIEEFTESSSLRVLIIADEELNDHALQNIPFLVHFELPSDPAIYLNRVSLKQSEENEETLSLVLATDIELSGVRKLEQLSGQKITIAELPENLVIQKERKSDDTEKVQPSKHKQTEPVVGAAFHEKKASNAKTYNYRAGLKAKMNKKKKH